MPELISDSSKTDQDRKWLWRWALLFVTSSVLLTGCRVYFHNQALQIPLVRLLNDPTLYPNDPFAATLPHYASSLWRVVAWGARIIPLEPLLLGFFLIERLIVIYAAGNLALAFAPRSRLAAVGAMAFLAVDPTPIIGGGTLLMPYFEQTSLSIGFFMLAMAAFHRRKPIPWALWLTAGFNCNSMYGCYALTYFGATFLIGSRYRWEWKLWLKAFALFALLSLPALALSTGAVGSGTTNADLWLAACRSRVPHHVFPSTWPWIKFVRFAVLALLVTDVVLLNRHQEHPEHVQGRSGRPRLRSDALIWTAVSLGWVAVAIAAEKLHSPMMLMLQPARATDLWYAYSVIATISVCARVIEQSHAPVPPESGSRNAIAASVLALIPFALFNPSGLLALVPLAGLTIAPAMSWLGRQKTMMLTAAVVLAFSVRAFMVRASDLGSSAACLRTPCRSMRLACDWARTHTAKDAVFLVNPNWGEFRALSARPAFVTWKDGSALLWNRPFARPWSERIGALGYDVTTGKLPRNQANRDLDRLYAGLDDSDARRLASRHGLAYWMVPSGQSSRLLVAYHNRYFKVLRLR